MRELLECLFGTSSGIEQRGGGKDTRSSRAGQLKQKHEPTRTGGQSSVCLTPNHRDQPVDEVWITVAQLVVVLFTKVQDIALALFEHASSLVEVSPVRSTAESRIHLRCVSVRPFGARAQGWLDAPPFEA